MQSRLGDLGIDSAWHLMPDAEIGVAGLPQPDEQLGAVVDKLTTGVSRVGVSPPYDDLRSTSKALRMARIALQSTIEQQQVVVFGEDMLGSVAAIAPDLATGMAKRVLGGLDCLTSTDRETILETFGAWLDNQGSADGAAKQLFVHPNTVRNRLRRLEERTGRCLSKPRSVAELSVAYEIDRRLHTAKAKGPVT
jgi:DNA-binding PucR family transcriptional regulator